MKMTDCFIRFTALLLIGLLLSGCAHQLKQAKTAKQGEASLLAENTYLASLPVWTQEKAQQGYVLIEINEVALLSEAQKSAINNARDLLQKDLLATIMAAIDVDDQKKYLKVGSLEYQVRQTLRNQVKLNLVVNLVRNKEWFDEKNKRYFGLYSLNSKTLKLVLAEELLRLDSQLLDYRHPTYLGSELEQLLSLAPVLPTLEARRIVKKAWVQEFGDLPKLPNEYLARLMDLQLSGLFGRMNISVDSLTAETAIYEPFLVAGLRDAGLNISARRPSLMVRYYIEQYIEEDEVVLVNDIEINHRDGNRFSYFNDEILVGFDPDDSLDKSNVLAAKTLAYSNLATGLKDLILSKLYTQIKVFNNHHFGR